MLTRQSVRWRLVELVALAGAAYGSYELIALRGLALGLMLAIAGAIGGYLAFEMLYPLWFGSSR